MGLDLPSEFFKSHKVRNFMHERHQKFIFIEVGVYCDLMFAAHRLSVVPMTCHAFVDNLEVYLIGNNKFEDRLDGMLRYIS